MNRLERRAHAALYRKEKSHRMNLPPTKPAPASLEMQIQATPQPDGQTIALVITFGPMQTGTLIPVSFVPQFIQVLQNALAQVPKVVVPSIIGVNGKPHS